MNARESLIVRGELSDAAIFPAAVTRGRATGGTVFDACYGHNRHVRDGCVGPSVACQTYLLNRHDTDIHNVAYYLTEGAIREGSR